MYNYKFFYTFMDLRSFLNENHIPKENVVSIIYKTHLEIILVYIESEEKDEKDNTTSNIPNYGGCYNCDKRKNGCEHKGKPRLCRKCDFKRTCPRYI